MLEMKCPKCNGDTECGEVMTVNNNFGIQCTNDKCGYYFGVHISNGELGGKVNDGNRTGTIIGYHPSGLPLVEWCDGTITQFEPLK